jgi:limonene-1,2-epoxide hydrolase
MIDIPTAVRAPALVLLEHELVVRDFLELLPLGTAVDLAPFLHDDVRFETAGSSQAVGREPLLRAWRAVVGRFAVFEIETVSVTSAAHRVLVEQRIRLALHPRCEPRSVLGFAAFDLRGARISGWRQLFG